MLGQKELSRDQLKNNYMIGTQIQDGLQDILDREAKPLSDLVDKWFENDLSHLYLVGSGGSRAVLEPAKWLLDQFSDTPADRYTGWEFLLRAPRNLDAHSAAVFGSHSGTTTEILQGVEFAKSRGASTLALSKEGTKLQEISDHGMTYNSAATNLSKLLMNYMVAAEVIERSGDKQAAAEMKKVFSTLPATLEAVKNDTEELGKELAVRHQNAKGFYLVATGPLYGLAYQFATCNLLEMQWKHASVYNAAEFPHGPLEIVDKDLPMIFLVGTDNSRDVALRAANFAKRHNADTIVLDLADLPSIHQWFAPFGLHMPLQWLISYMGVVRDHPIQTRRYMGIENYYQG